MRSVRGMKRGGVVARVAGLGLALVVSAAVLGCGEEVPDGYDESLRYPLRADVIVVQTPPTQPAKPAEPGKRDEELAKLGSVGGRTLDPARLPDADRQTLRQTLDAMFGTPAAPTVPAEIAASDPHLSADELAKGSRLYRRSCAHCHGLTGDGRGPTGLWLYPYPRDFRQGVYKTAGGSVGAKPTRVELARVIRAGVPGTSMPAFDLIPEADVAALVGYTIHLSLRGEAELRATTTVLGDADDGPGEVGGEAVASTARAWKQWQNAGEPPVPAVAELGGDSPEQTESIRRGHALFAGSAACIGCHADYGRAEQYRYDVWGGAARVPDLTRGEYRWGKRPSDLARRVRHGIPGVGMPANPGLTDEQVRDVVAFLQALPVPPRLPADVRERVYPGTGEPTANR